MVTSPRIETFPDETTRRPSERPFADIVREHERMVFSIALHSLASRPLAEEIAQDVFLELYRNLDRLESDEHLLFWLRRVTSHRCIDAVRRRRIAVGIDSVVELTDLQEPGDPLLERTLRLLLTELPPAQRIAVTLRYQEDLTPAEIAKILSVPLATARSHLRRGLATLRRRLDKSRHGRYR